MFWEGCQVEEPDDRPLSLFAKDGDAFALIPDLLLPEDDLPGAPDHGHVITSHAEGAATSGRGGAAEGGGGVDGLLSLLLPHDSSAGLPSFSSRGHAPAEPSMAAWGLPATKTAPAPAAAATKRPYRSAAAAQEDLPYCLPEHEGRKRRAEAATSQGAAASGGGDREGPYSRSLSLESGSCRGQVACG